MGGRAEILIAKRENVLSVPVDALLSYEGHYRVAVRKPDGNVELREVSVGLSDGKVVEITQGLSSGDAVVLKPLALMGGQIDDQRASAKSKRKTAR